MYLMRAVISVYMIINDKSSFYVFFGDVFFQSLFSFF